MADPIISPEVGGILAMAFGVLWALLPRQMMHLRATLTHLGTGEHAVSDHGEIGQTMARFGGLFVAGLGGALYLGMIP